MIGEQISLPQRVDQQLCLSDRETCQDGTRVMHYDFIFLLVCGVKKKLGYLHSLKTHTITMDSLQDFNSIFREIMLRSVYPQSSFHFHSWLCRTRVFLSL